MPANSPNPSPGLRQAPYTLLAIAVLALALVPIGGAVFVLGFVFGDSPCVMCWEQRIGMTLVALIGLFILRFGARPKYVGLSVLVGAWGIFMGLRHTGMHAARDIGQGFSAEILGAHTYTWSLFVFWVCTVTIGVLLMALKQGEDAAGPRQIRPLEKTAMVVFLIVVAGNIVQAFASTGPPPYMGQSDPVRFSFRPSHWVWSLEEWGRVPVSLRGRWAAEKPHVSGLKAEPGSGPLSALPMLTPGRQARLTVPLEGSVTDLAYDEATDRFLLTTEHGVYILDGSLEKLLRYTVVDPRYSVDLGKFAGAAFLDSSTVMALGENKSYVVLREDDKANAEANFRFFLESFDRFSEVSRSRLSTVRARMMYAMSLAFDPASNSLYTVSVPNAKTKRLVLSRFDRADFVLSEEFAPSLADDAGVAMKPGRSLEEFYVTGATIAGSRMYAISAAFGTLLTIDLPSRELVAAHGISGIARPTGIALKGDSLYIVSDDARVSILNEIGTR